MLVPTRLRQPWQRQQLQPSLVWGAHPPILPDADDGNGRSDRASSSAASSASRSHKVIYQGSDAV